MKFLKSVLLFLFNFYKAIWIWFLGLPRAGKVLVGSFLVFALAISSLANSGQNGQVKGVKSANLSSNFSQKSSSSKSSFSSSFSSSSENLANNSENFTENLAKSTEISAKLPDGVENSTQNPIESAKISQNLDNSSQKSTVANTDDAIKSLLANNEEPVKSVLSNPEEAIKTDISKLETTQTNKKLYQILEVVDGDTVKVSEIGTLRLIGIDTPETKDPRLVDKDNRRIVQCFGKEASENAEKILSGQKVWLEFDETHARTDKYQRTLAYIFREDGYFYNLEAVKNGFAHSYREYPHPRLDEFNLAEKEAVSSKVGFWADNTCQGNTEQGAGGEVAKSTVPPTGGTPSQVVEKPAAGNFDSNGDGKVTCKDFKGQVTDPNILALYPKLDGNSDGVGCESN